MTDNNPPPDYEDVTNSSGSTLERVPRVTTESAANIANQEPDTARIIIQLQNVTAALQTLTAEQHALNLELASLRSRIIATEARTLNIRIRERNAVATATSSAQGTLEPLYDVRHGGVIPNCPTTELAITKMTNFEASRILGALGVYYNNDILSPFSDLQAHGVRLNVAAQFSSLLGFGFSTFRFGTLHLFAIYFNKPPRLLGAMSTADSGYTATDIITYIGVPLAVLGVLPILYNTAATLTSLSKIKRMLRHSRLTALTRSDVVNRVIEVELPRYAVRPWDRFDNRSEYWQTARQPSQIPGGSWTTFNWRSQTVGLKTQRVEYADQLRQPQVDVAFDELVCYLLDLGALPDPHGWRLLRSSGLWTPVGCPLLMSPDGLERALTIAPLDDSDGHLSLKVHWRPDWTSRDHSHLPPYWVRLPPAPIEVTGSSHGESSGSTATDASAFPPAEEGDPSSIRKESIDSAQQEIDSNRTTPITCQISGHGLISAVTRGNRPQSDVGVDSLYIEHLRIRPGSTVGIWFASAATAFGRTSQTVLWNYRIPDDVLSFARKDSVPCGVLEVLGIVNSGDTPEWATNHSPDHMTALDVHIRRMNEQRTAMAAEALMPAAQREAAARDRMRWENESRLQDQRERLRRDNERRNTRITEVIQSPRWDVGRVAEYHLAWLESKNHIASGVVSIKDVVGGLLHRMVLEGEFATRICTMLDLWKAWADNGGMRRSDFEALKEDQLAFAYATFLAALIRDTSAALDGTLSVDLQECLSMWRQVRLG